MALSLGKIETFARACGCSYMVDPAAPNLLVSEEVGDDVVQYAISIQDDGDFLLFRTIDLERVPDSDPHLEAVQKVVASAGGRYRGIKFVRYSSSGEIAVSAEMWLLDMRLTQNAFMRTHLTFLEALREFHLLVKQAVSEGTAPDLDPLPKVTDI